MSQSQEKNSAVMGTLKNQGIFDHFGLFSDKQEFSKKTWLP